MLTFYIHRIKNFLLLTTKTDLGYCGQCANLIASIVCEKSMWIRELFHLHVMYAYIEVYLAYLHFSIGHSRVKL